MRVLHTTSPLPTSAVCSQVFHVGVGIAEQREIRHLSHCTTLRPKCSKQNPEVTLLYFYCGHVGHIVGEATQLPIPTSGWSISISPLILFSSRPILLRVALGTVSYFRVHISVSNYAKEKASWRRQDDC